MSLKSLIHLSSTDNCEKLDCVRPKAQSRTLPIVSNMQQNETNLKMVIEQLIRQAISSLVTFARDKINWVRKGVLRGSAGFPYLDYITPDITLLNKFP